MITSFVLNINLCKIIATYHVNIPTCLDCKTMEQDFIMIVVFS